MKPAINPSRAGEVLTNSRCAGGPELSTKLIRIDTRICQDFHCGFAAFTFSCNHSLVKGSCVFSSDSFERQRLHLSAILWCEAHRERTGKDPNREFESCRDDIAACLSA